MNKIALLIIAAFLTGCAGYATTKTELPCPNGVVKAETGPKRIANVTCDGVEYEQVNTEVQGILGSVLRFVLGV